MNYKELVTEYKKLRDKYFSLTYICTPEANSILVEMKRLADEIKQIEASLPKSTADNWRAKYNI